MPSLVAELGSIVEDHLKSIGLMFDADLSGDLRTYFAGLAKAVSPKTFDATRHQATVTREASAIGGTVTTVDAFGDGHTLDLRVAGEIVTCTGGRTGLVLSLSPRSDAGTWDMLAAQRRTMRC